MCHVYVHYTQSKSHLADKASVCCSNPLPPSPYHPSLEKDESQPERARNVGLSVYWLLNFAFATTTGPRAVCCLL